MDAVITGMVFAAGEKLKILAKLIDVKSGRVLAAALAEDSREWPRLPDVPDMDFQWDGPPPRPGGIQRFRDAPADKAAPACEQRKSLLSARNSELVDIKARFWAARMKEPGFSIRGLSRNPGTEISDPETKALFYKLLNEYYRTETPPKLGKEDLISLKTLIEEETSAVNDCGYW